MQRTVRKPLLPPLSIPAIGGQWPKVMIAFLAVGLSGLIFALVTGGVSPAAAMPAVQEVATQVAAAPAPSTATILQTGPAWVEPFGEEDFDPSRSIHDVFAIGLLRLVKTLGIAQVIQALPVAPGVILVAGVASLMATRLFWYFNAAAPAIRKGLVSRFDTSYISAMSVMAVVVVAIQALIDPKSDWTVAMAGLFGLLGLGHLLVAGFHGFRALIKRFSRWRWPLGIVLGIGLTEALMGVAAPALAEVTVTSAAAGSTGSDSYFVKTMVGVAALTYILWRLRAPLHRAARWLQRTWQRIEKDPRTFNVANALIQSVDVFLLVVLLLSPLFFSGQINKETLIGLSTVGGLVAGFVTLAEERPRWATKFLLFVPSVALLVVLLTAAPAWAGDGTSIGVVDLVGVGVLLGVLLLGGVWVVWLSKGLRRVDTLIMGMMFLHLSALLAFFSPALLKGPPPTPSPTFTVMLADPNDIPGLHGSATQQPGSPVTFRDLRKELAATRERLAAKRAQAVTPEEQDRLAVLAEVTDGLARVIDLLERRQHLLEPFTLVAATLQRFETYVTFSFGVVTMMILSYLAGALSNLLHRLTSRRGGFSFFLGAGLLVPLAAVLLAAAPAWAEGLVPSIGPDLVTSWLFEMIEGAQTQLLFTLRRINGVVGEYPWLPPLLALGFLIGVMGYQRLTASLQRPGAHGTSDIEPKEGGAMRVGLLVGVGLGAVLGMLLVVLVPVGSVALTAIPAWAQGVGKAVIAQVGLGALGAGAKWGLIGMLVLGWVVLARRWIYGHGIEVRIRRDRQGRSIELERLIRSVERSVEESNTGA